MLILTLILKRTLLNYPLYFLEFSRNFLGFSNLEIITKPKGTLCKQNFDQNLFLIKSNVSHCHSSYHFLGNSLIINVLIILVAFLLIKLFILITNKDIHMTVEYFWGW